MKRIVAGLLTFALSSTLFALPIGNPWDASLLCDGVFCEGTCCTDFCDPCARLCDAWSVRAGFYGDYIFDRHLKVDTSGNTRTIHKTEIYTNAGYLAVNFFNRADIFTTLGATELNIVTNREALGGPPTDYITIETDTSFSWSIGGRVTIWECGCLGLGVEGQYFHSSPEYRFVKEENAPPDYSLDGKHIHYHEWQLGVGASYRINIASCATALVPYAGVKWSGACVDLGDETPTMLQGITLPKLESDRCWGYALGMTLVGCNKASLTVEGRFADEKAIHFNGQIRF